MTENRTITIGKKDLNKSLFLQTAWFCQGNLNCLQGKVREISGSFALSSLYEPWRRFPCCQFFIRASMVLGLFLISSFWVHIMKTCLLKYTENFTTKTENFQIKNSDIIYISAQNIDCRYSLDPPRRGGSKEYPQSMFLSRNKKK